MPRTSEDPRFALSSQPIGEPIPEDIFTRAVEYADEGEAAMRLLVYGVTNLVRKHGKLSSAARYLGGAVVHGAKAAFYGIEFVGASAGVSAIEDAFPDDYPSSENSGSFFGLAKAMRASLRSEELIG